jgi:16S rRNA G1207 methylase RsmC
LAIVLAERFRPSTIHLVDRDLLALRYTRVNLEANGFPVDAIHMHHQPALEQAQLLADLALGTIRDDEGPEAIEYTVVQLAHCLKEGGHAVLVGQSTPVTRLTKSSEINRHFRLSKRRRNKGYSAVILQRRGG